MPKRPEGNPNKDGSRGKPAPEPEPVEEPVEEDE